jgi:protein ImuA
MVALQVLPQPYAREAGAARCAEWKPKNPKLAALAEQVRRIQARGRGPVRRCPSGLDELDAALGGGFAVPGVHELLAPCDGSAARSIALRTAAHAAGARRWIFYLDTTGDFYPPGASRIGVPLGRLLIIRTQRPFDALWVCEQALRCRAVAAVVLPLRSIDAYVSRRLQLAAEAGGGLGLLIRDDPRGGHTFAASRLQFDPVPGDTVVRRMLVSVLKLRDGRPVQPFVMELPDAAGVVPAHALPGDRPGAARRAAAAG